MRTKYDFSVTQQVSDAIAIEIVNELGQPRDLSGLLFKLDCRQSVNSDTVYFSLGSGDNTIYLDSLANHKIWLVFTHDLTKLLNFDKGVYDLVAYKSDKTLVEVLMSGTVTLNRTVTQLE